MREWAEAAHPAVEVGGRQAHCAHAAEAHPRTRDLQRSAHIPIFSWRFCLKALSKLR